MASALFSIWSKQLLAGQCFSDFGATVAGSAQNTYEAALVHHLTPDENRGKNHIYVDVVDSAGQLVRGDALRSLRIGWTWEGRRSDEAAPPVTLDKGLDEPAGNVPIYKGMKVTVWLKRDVQRISELERDSQRVSDLVGGLHGMVEDVGSGNTWNHNSFYIIFRERSAKPVELNPAVPALDEWQSRLAIIDVNVQALKKLAGL